MYLVTSYHTKSKQKVFFTVGLAQKIANRVPSTLAHRVINA